MDGSQAHFRSLRSAAARDRAKAIAFIEQVSELTFTLALEHVVRTRLYVTDISRWEEVGRVHGEVFGSIRPATSMIEVNKLIDPALLVEIEADALVP